MTRCRKRSEFELVLESPRAAPRQEEATEEEEDDALLPFGVEIGEAVPTPFGYAAAGIRGVGEAFVAVLGAGRSRRVELGELHGDAETPAVASYGQSLLVALRTTDAAGFTIKLGRIAGPESGSVEWGYELTKLGRSVTSVELAATAGGGVLVYQGELKKQPRLMLGSFSPEQLATPFEPKPLEVKDAEMPRVLARAGGYWLSWVRSLPEPKKAAPVTSAEPTAPRDPEERELLDPGLRVVEVVKLDEQGRALGTALRVGEPRRQVILYDVATQSDGGLLVATRSDSAAPGAEGGAILLSTVSADGTVRAERLEDDEIGAGAPTLLMDADPGRPGPWLAVSGPNDATRLGLALGAGTRLQSDPLLGRSEVIAVSAGHFLAQRARGNSVVFEALDCSWPAAAEAEKK
ncbi:MAG: hypothetical protein EOO73_19995 [Myxococcales bacterium]|nr:MAG: hypothetical protein EOO73_19995 [Myxococcales bacterium]